MLRPARYAWRWRFRLAREQLDRAHFAQIHAHRIIGTVKLFGRSRAKRQFALLTCGHKFGVLLLFFLGLFILDDVDAHFRKHRHDVFDLLGRNLIRRQHLIKLVVSDVALLTCLGDHLLDRCLAHIK